MKNIYEVSYHGLWLGGVAIVIADSEEEAIELVNQDSATVAFTNITTKVIQKGYAKGVLYNDNGDY